MADARDFSRLGDLLGDACERPANVKDRTDQAREAARHRRMSGHDDPTRTIALAWPDLVGTEVAANARPVQLRQGRLVVSVSSPAWAQTLQLMSETLLRALGDRVGRGVVRQVVFRHAGWEKFSDVPRTPEADRGDGARDDLTADQEAALAQVEELDIPHELRNRIIRAMRAAFARGGTGSVR